MGNRFKDMAGYHALIIAHGVIATIVFLGIVPTSAIIIRYYSRWNPYWAFKLHAWCQVLTLLLTTVVFVLGWFAVGPARSLTNPHHGIGLAIYVIVIFQVLWGWFLHKRESKRQRLHVPMKLVVSCSTSESQVGFTNLLQFHRWLGRALVIIGIVQIPLGLTLYGSPKVLFILFALAVFAYLVLYFILSYRYDEQGYHMGSDHGGGHSHYTGPSEVSEPHNHHTGEALAAGAMGAGLASMFRRRPRSRHASQAYEDSRTSLSDEKYSDESSRHNGGGGFGKKLLEIGALAGAGLMAKKFWDRRKKKEEDTESGRYKPAHSRSHSYSDESLSRLEDGRPEPTHTTPLNRPPSRAPSRSQSPGSSYYYNSTYFTEPPRREASHKLRDTAAGVGAFAAVKRFFSRNKKDDAERERLDDIRRREDEDETLQRANSKRRPQAGESFYPRRRASSYSETDLTETDLSRPPPPRHAPHGESVMTGEPLASGAVHSSVSEMPPMPPVHHHGYSGDLPSERPHSRHSIPHDGSEFASGAAAGAALDAASRRNRSSSRRREEDVASPPVSVKVKMHNDGRHVTLRRLTEEEAAASREARRRERRNSRRRSSSAGSLSGNEDAGYDRWRRVEELERQQEEQMRREQAAAAGGPSAPLVAPSGPNPASSWAAPPSQVSQMPPPPPIPAPSSMPYGPGSITSPPYTATEMSGSYANNRRRRRAERARTRQERQQQHGVEFT